MIDDLGFPLDPNMIWDHYQKYVKSYDGVKKYVEHEWKILLPTDQSPIPAKSAKIKWLVRHGIPMELRAKLWYFYSGAEQSQKSHPELFSLLYFKELQDIQLGYSKDDNKIMNFVEMIDQDLLRTFPNHPKFCPGMGLSISLRKILVAFAYYSFPHPDILRKPIRTCTYQIGYCQSLNFIVGFLLLVFSRSNDSVQDVKEDIEEKVFWLLITIVEKLMPQKMYGSDIVGARMQQQILWKWIIEEHGESFGLSQLSKWLHETDRRLDPFLSITTGWFMNLFITFFPNDTTLRILDSFFYQGEKTLYRTAIGLLQIYQKDIIGFHDWFDACRYIKNAPKRMIQGHILIERMFRKFNPREIRQRHADDTDQYVWVTLQNSYLPGEKRDSFENLEFQSSSHLGKSVIAHARYAISTSNRQPTGMHAIKMIESGFNAMFFSTDQPY